jgi:hypothetical protein
VSLPGEDVGELHLGLSLPSAIPTSPGFPGAVARPHNVLPVSPFAAVGSRPENSPNLSFRKQLSHKLSQQLSVGALAAGRQNSNSSNSAVVILRGLSSSKSMRTSGGSCRESPAFGASPGSMNSAAGNFLQRDSRPPVSREGAGAATSREANLSPLRANAGKLAARGKLTTLPQGAVMATREAAAAVECKQASSGCGVCSGGLARGIVEQRNSPVLCCWHAGPGSISSDKKDPGSALAAIATAAGSSRSPMERQLSRALEKASASQGVAAGCCSGIPHYRLHQNHFGQVLEQEALELAAVEAASGAAHTEVLEFETALQMQVAAEVAERRAGHAWILADLATQEAQEYEQEAQLLAALGLPSQHNVPLDLMVQPSLMRTRSNSSLGAASNCNPASRKGSCDMPIGNGVLGACERSASRKGSSLGSGCLPSSRNASSEGQISSAWFSSSRKGSSEGQIGSGAFPSSRLGSAEGQIVPGCVSSSTGSRLGSSEVQVGPGWTSSTSPLEGVALNQYSLELSPLGQRPSLTASSFGSKIPKRETAPEQAAAQAAVFYPAIPAGLTRSGCIPYAGELTDAECHSPPGAHFATQLRPFKHGYPMLEVPDLASVPERRGAGAAASYGVHPKGANAAAAVQTAVCAKLPASAVDPAPAEKQLPSSFPMKAAMRERQSSDAACLLDSGVNVVYVAHAVDEHGHGKQASKGTQARTAPAAAATWRQQGGHFGEGADEAGGQDASFGYPRVPSAHSSCPAARQGVFRSDSANSIRERVVGQEVQAVASSNGAERLRPGLQEEEQQGQENSGQKSALGSSIRARIDELRQRMQGASPGGKAAKAAEAGSSETERGGHSKLGLVVETRVKEAEAAIAAAAAGGNRATGAPDEAGSVGQQKHHHHGEDCEQHHMEDRSSSRMQQHYQHRQQQQPPAATHGASQCFGLHALSRQMDSAEWYPSPSQNLANIGDNIAITPALPAAPPVADAAVAQTTAQTAFPGRPLSFPAVVSAGVEQGPQLPLRWLQLPQGGSSVAGAVDCYPQLPQQYPEAVVSPTPSAPVNCE